MFSGLPPTFSFSGNVFLSGNSSFAIFNNMTSFLRKATSFRKLLIGGGVTATVAGYYVYNNNTSRSKFTRDTRNTDLMKRVPSRIEMLETMKSGRNFDVLVIGGGATGTGIALVCFMQSSSFLNNLIL